MEENYFTSDRSGSPQIYEIDVRSSLKEDLLLKAAIMPEHRTLIKVKLYLCTDQIPTSILQN